MAHAPTTGRPVVLAVALLVVAYAGACLFGWPQQGRDLIVAASRTVEPAAAMVPPGVIWIAPFALLLISIAVAPLTRVTARWWDSNLHRFYVAAGLAVVTLLYYLLGHRWDVEGHWPISHVVNYQSGAALQWRMAWSVFAHAILGDYVPFIVLLLSLFTISGGIRIEGDLAAHPLTNTAFLAAGGLLASLIGTTGASMLLIRPLLETNRERRHVAHTVVLFIFIACNCGGCLLPLGDPPLFLGYLRGVGFFWTMQLWKEWLFVNGLLLVVYFLWDYFIQYPREDTRDVVADESQIRPLVFSGLKNCLLLLGVLACVALLEPVKSLPGTDWHPWLYLREICELLLVAVSLLLGPQSVRQKNRFSFSPMVEVAALFFGIFICMQPALQILHARAPQLPLKSPARFFWASGGLSSVLDNAPTYVVFFETAKATGRPGDLGVGGGTIDPLLLAAISLGSVMMGSMTYIGNGPNFMVRAMAEEAGVRMPSFFAYLKYSCGILLPLLLLMCWLFL